MQACVLSLARTPEGSLRPRFVEASRDSLGRLSGTGAGSLGSLAKVQP